jgi:hypothetical protein
MKNLGGVVPVTPAPMGVAVEELEINDYPELARAKGVTRDTRLQLEEQFGVKIAMKGQYFGPGQTIPVGGRKLFVEISGANKNAVLRARKAVFESVEQWAIKTLNIPEEMLRPKKKRKA